MTTPRLAIVHERFTEVGGSERVVEALHGVWPDAPIHVPLLDRAALPPGLVGADIRPSHLQALYRPGPRYAHLLPLFPAAMRSLDLHDADVVVTSHHAFANRVRVRSDARVVSYTHSPARWMWDPHLRSYEVGSRLGRAGLGLFTLTQRRPDRAAADRVDLVVVNSRHVARRVEQWWGRDSCIIHPPVDIDFFVPADIQREDFFLVAGRLVPYKRPEVAVAAAKIAGVRMVVVGEGRSRSAAQAEAATGTVFLGSVDRDTLRDLLRRCRALVFPGVEDFGIIPVEAQACGTPVVALGVGGVLDSVIDGVTGVLYPECLGPEMLAEALATFPDHRFDPGRIRAHATKFSGQVFASKMHEVVDPLMETDSPLGQRRIG